MLEEENDDNEEDNNEIDDVTNECDKTNQYQIH